jgi:hypothetical protein
MADTTLADALSLITKVSSSTDKRLSLLEKVLGKKVPATAGGSEKKVPRQVVKKAEPVIVTDFGKKAEQDLGRLSGDPGSKDSKDGDPGKSGTGFLKKLIGPALLVLGGLAALVTGLMSDGPLKGLLKILAKGGIIGGVKLFQKMASKQIGKFTGMFAKILPKGLFKTVITKATDFLKGIGKFLLAPFKKLGGKAAGKGLFGTITKLFGKLLKPILKRIPGIGSLISWGFAISRFKSGDLIGGLIDVASGIATLFPGIGTGISIGLDVLNAFLDSKKGKEGEVKPAGAPGGIGAFFGKIKDKIMNNFPIKNLVQFWTGVGKVFKGDFKEGFTQMAFAIPFMKSLANFLFGEREEVDPETGEVTKKKSIVGAIKESMMKKIKAGWLRTPNWLKRIMRKFLPDKVIKALDGEAASTEDGEEAGPASEDGKERSMVDALKESMMKRLKAGWARTAEWLKKITRRFLPDKVVKVLDGEAPEPRRRGGPVKRNQKYLVGEEGPELFVPEVSGTIKNNKSTMEMLENNSTMGAMGTGDIVKASLDGNNLIKSLRDTNNNLLETQIGLLQESASILREIAEKTGAGAAGANIVTSNRTTVTNMNSERSLRDLQEMYV